MKFIYCNILLFCFSLNSFSQKAKAIEIKGYVILELTYDSVYKYYSFDKRKFCDTDLSEYSIINSNSVYNITECFKEELKNYAESQKRLDTLDFYKDYFKIEPFEKQSNLEIKLLRSNFLYKDNYSKLFLVKYITAKAICFKKICNKYVVNYGTPSFCGFALKPPFLFFIQTIINEEIKETDLLRLGLLRTDIKEIPFINCY